VVGFARLMEQDEDRTLARLKAHRKELIEPLVAEYQGRTVKLTGDGALCEFGSVVDAVRCAVLIQQGMAERERDVPEEERLCLRIGINLGDVVHEDDGDLYGDGVNIAARLEQLCEPGGVLVSGTAYDHLRGKIDLPLEFAGQQRVKNIERLVRAYRIRLDGTGRRRLLGAQPRGRTRLPAAVAVAVVLTVLVLAAGAWWFRPVAPSGEQQRSIAVLPLLNASGDPEQDYLSDGVTEDIIAQLSRFQDLTVIASDSTATYKGKPVTPQEVGRTLGVGYVMSGSIARSGDRLRVSVRVSDARTGRQVWGESYDNQARDLLAVRDEVTSRVVGTLAGLQGRLTKDVRSIVRGKQTASVDAYTLVLRGDDFLNRYTKEDNDVARDLFRQALAVDPEYALAYADLAWSEVLAWQFGWGDDPARSLELALEYAERAVALDDLDADAHGSSATCSCSRGSTSGRRPSTSGRG
jgi:TolB-like protein